MEHNRGYLDFHCHILPGVDDGAKDMEMTKKMLEIMHQQGVGTILATPHFYPWRTSCDTDGLRELAAQVDAMAKEIDPDMKVLSGNEILYSDNIVQELRNGNVLSLANSRYVLVEFLPRERRSKIEQGIRTLLEAGYAPVIAHVERVEAIFGDEQFAGRIHAMGCYMQSNTQSLMGGVFDKNSKRLKKWIEKDYIQFLGSDCHNTDNRAPLMGDAIKRLEKSLSEKTLERVLYKNQDLFLAGKYI